MSWNKVCFVSLIPALLFTSVKLYAQDSPPIGAAIDKASQTIVCMYDARLLDDTIAFCVVFPAAFQQIGNNEIEDKEGLLNSFMEQLRKIRIGVSHDSVRVVHIGDSHVRGHIYPRTAGMCLARSFGAVSYVDMGINGATCASFTDSKRIESIQALSPDLLILSFGTNESHNRRYNSVTHYEQIGELVRLIRAILPDTPILLTTPPGSYESYRAKGRKRTYVVNKRTELAVETIKAFAQEHHLLVWDMYNVIGGKQRACANWTEAGLMRPDHIHYLPQGYELQGELLCQALIKAYNHYVSN